MKELGTFFFIMTPFGYLCADNGAGLLTGTAFLVLGIICKNWDKIYDPTPKVKIPNNEFWEHQYRIASRDRIDIDARDWATTVCRAHGAWVPPESTQETIAKRILHAKGQTTYIEERDKKRHINRIQYAKMYYMKKAMEWYDTVTQETIDAEIPQGKYVEHIKIDSLRKAIKRCYEDIYIVGKQGAYIWWNDKTLRNVFGVKTEEELWNRYITQSEKTEAKRWVIECVSRVIKEEIKDVTTYKTTIHDWEYLNKYGFYV